MKALIKITFAALLVVIAGRSFAKPALEEARIDDRHLTGFHAVDVSGSFDVFITQGSSESVKVEAPDEVIDKIITEVTGDGVLKIYNKRNFNWNDWFGGRGKKIAIYVNIKDVDAVQLTGSGDVYFKDGLRSPSLKIALTGSGDLGGRIETKSLECRLSGSGDIKLAGHAETSVVNVIGSGDYHGRDLATVNTTARVAGSGDAAVNVSDSLNASVSGSGDVKYSGSPKHLMTSKAGSGDIERD